VIAVVGRLITAGEAFRFEVVLTGTSTVASVRIVAVGIGRVPTSRTSILEVLETGSGAVAGVGVVALRTASIAARRPRKPGRVDAHPDTALVKRAFLSVVSTQQTIWLMSWITLPHAVTSVRIVAVRCAGVTASHTRRLVVVQAKAGPVTRVRVVTLRVAAIATRESVDLEVIQTASGTVACVRIVAVCIRRITTGRAHRLIVVHAYTGPVAAIRIVTVRVVRVAT
jgi:hypothetical protein